jgi:hypothetical protein
MGPEGSVFFGDLRILKDHVAGWVAADDQTLRDLEGRA